MQVRQAAGTEMLELWGYQKEADSSPTARYFYRNNTSGNAVFWALDHEGQLVGELYAFLDIEEDRAFADGQTRAYLCAFRVMKEYRGQGYGRRLMDAAVRDLKARGFRYATIGVDDVENEKLYRHMGFVTKVRDCHDDPCARDANMRPVADEAGYRLLLREL